MAAVPTDGRDIGPSDPELVRRAQAGESAAFAAIVTRYQDRVFNTILRMCRNRADAADLTQTTFLKALEALGSFEARAGVYTWLFRIAVNLTISFIRGQKRKPASLQQPDLSGRPRDPKAPAKAGEGPDLETRELLHKLEAALAELDEEFRAAVVLRDIEGLDYATIGQVLALPVGTVKSRIHRGRALLRDKMLGDVKARGAATD